MTDLPPWHDAPHCTCGGPMVPSDGSGTHPTEVADPGLLRCSKCGAWETPDLETEDGVRRLVRAWWSAGAWAGHKATVTP